MKTWNAFQIAQSNGAYAGRTVRFRNIGGERVEAVLARSFQPSGSPTVLLTVATGKGHDVHTVGAYQFVEVA